MTGHVLDDETGGAEGATGPNPTVETVPGSDLETLVYVEEDGTATVTVFPAGIDEADLVTTWVTADIDAVVDLADVR